MVAQPTRDSQVHVQTLMSYDIRRKIAYFGPSCKVYASEAAVEVPGLGLTWRRILSHCYPFPVVGPFGCQYPDIEHAMVGYRYLMASNQPGYAMFFRTEFVHSKPEKIRRQWCKKWGDTYGMSFLMTDPQDDVWIVCRDRWMFDLVFQRIARDVQYRTILRILVAHDLLPVYHIRTSTSDTYWGATINRERAQKPYSQASELLLGKNRLGEIMVQALATYHQMFDMPPMGRVREHIYPLNSPPLPPLTRVALVLTSDEEKQWEALLEDIAPVTYNEISKERRSVVPQHIQSPIKRPCLSTESPDPQRPVLL